MGWGGGEGYRDERGFIASKGVCHDGLFITRRGERFARLKVENGGGVGVKNHRHFKMAVKARQI